MDKQIFVLLWSSQTFNHLQSVFMIDDKNKIRIKIRNNPNEQQEVQYENSDEIYHYQPQLMFVTQNQKIEQIQSIQSQSSSSQETIQKQQQIQEIYLESISTQQSKLYQCPLKKLSYFRGLISYLSNLKHPIFAQSLKYRRGKKPNIKKQTYFTCVQKNMTQVAKRFDETLQDQFELLTFDKMLSHDITQEALRALLQDLNNQQTRKILVYFLKRYQAHRKWAKLLASHLEDDEENVEPNFDFWNRENQ